MMKLLACVGLATCFCAMSAPVARAQTFTVIHAFTDGGDGASPLAGLTFDSTGNFYGTASRGGDAQADAGVVFKLSQRSDVLTPLYTFHGTFLYQFDGGTPAGRVVFGPNGALFGTTELGGTPSCGTGRDRPPPLDGTGCGTVFSLTPPASFCQSVQCQWRETQLIVFGENGAEGNYPFGDLLINQAGNIFGSAGPIYELTQSGGGWIESVLGQFNGGSGGGSANGGLVSDAAGNLYGTATYGGLMGGCYLGGGCGVVFKLTPAGGSWTETVLYTFSGGSDGGNPYSGLIFDELGNLYGTTSRYGSAGGGTVFELSPSAGGEWAFSVIYSLAGNGLSCGSYASLTFDMTGSLYGTTRCDGANQMGSVFRLSPSGSGWRYASLHDFTGGSDGGQPYSNVIFDSVGNLYGTTYMGGLNVQGCGGYGCGVVWEITP